MPARVCYTIRMLEEPTLDIGSNVLYFDDNKQPHAAIVARVLSEEVVDGSRPRVNLTWLGYDARWRAATFVEPAHHNGERWITLQKWAFPGEVPIEAIKEDYTG